MAMCLSLSATVILCCLFVPKLRVVLLKPERNVRSKSKSISSATLKLVANTHSAKSQILKANLNEQNHIDNNNNNSNKNNLISNSKVKFRNSVKKDIKTSNVELNEIKIINTVKSSFLNNAESSTEKSFDIESNISNSLYKVPLLNEKPSKSDERINSIQINNENLETKIKQKLIEKEMGEITFDENNNNRSLIRSELSENTIKKLVEQCFDQLSKSNKITSDLLNIGENIDTNTENNKKLTKSISYDADDDDDDNENKKTKFAITLVEKKLNVLNGPTNTILLGNKDDQLNSLKITFV